MAKGHWRETLATAITALIAMAVCSCDRSRAPATATPAPVVAAPVFPSVGPATPVPAPNTATALSVHGPQKCNPTPKILRAGKMDDDYRESRAQPRGRLIAEFTVTPDGSVIDPLITDSTTVPADYLNALVLSSVLRFKFERVPTACRHRLAFNFK
jgi:hypothetical protein